MKDFDHLTKKEKEELKTQIYLCRCDCGNELRVSAYDLLSGKSKCCGHCKTYCEYCNNKAN
jgi:hypothetical protein